jgi:hypothetical protein
MLDGKAKKGRKCRIGWLGAYYQSENGSFRLKKQGEKRKGAFPRSINKKCWPLPWWFAGSSGCCQDANLA